MFNADRALLSWLLTRYSETLSWCLFSGIVPLAAAETNNLMVKDLPVIFNNTIKSAHVPIYSRMTCQRMIDFM